MNRQKTLLTPSPGFGLRPALLASELILDQFVLGVELTKS